MKQEVWLDIQGTNGQYQISSLGNVKSFKLKEPKILKPHYSKTDGYARLILRIDGKNISKRIHRLVAEAFIENDKQLPVINHKDEDPRNNSIDNLEWCSYRYNNTYGTMRERIKNNTDYKLIGDKNSKEVLQLDSQGNLLRIWKSANECKRELGFDNSSIAKCCNGHIKYAYGFKWKYNLEKVGE